MTSTAVVLAHHLNELGGDDFKKFKWYLTGGKLPSIKSIPVAKMENATREEAASLMVAQYGLSEAGRVAEQVLGHMQQNNLAEKLKDQLAQVQDPKDEAASSASDAAGTPGAPGASGSHGPPGVSVPLGLTQNIKAESGGKVGAQVISGNQFSGPLTLNFS